MVVKNQIWNRLWVAIEPWLVSLSASLFLFYEFIQGNIFATIADLIMRDFHIQADKVGYLSSTYYLANVFFLFIAGLLLDKFSPKKIILVVMFFCLLSTVWLAETTNFYCALICRFITGIGSAFCFLAPLRIASNWFKPQRMALVTSIIITLAMGGGMIAQYPVAKLVVVVGWRTTLIYVSAAGLLMLLFMALTIKEQEKKYANIKHNLMPVKVIFKKTYYNLQILSAALYTSLMNMPIAIYGAMMGTLYIMQRIGINKEEAAIVNMMLFLGAIVGGPLFAWCSDKLALRILPMKIGATAALITILIILFIPVSLTTMQVLFFCLGLFTAAQTISYAYVAECCDLTITATAISVVSFFTQSGYIIYQNLFSILLIKHGSLHVVAGIPIYSTNAYFNASLIIPIGLILAIICLYSMPKKLKYSEAIS